jgi:hypothetical protein
LYLSRRETKVLLLHWTALLGWWLHEALLLVEQHAPWTLSRIKEHENVPLDDAYQTHSYLFNLVGERSNAKLLNV